MDPRPLIVHVYKDVFPPVEGGIERIIHHLAIALADKFRIKIIVAARDGAGSTRHLESGAEVVEVACGRRLFSTPLAPGFLPALRASGANLFHFHTPHPTGELAYLLSGLRTPAVLTYHSDVVRQRAIMLAYGPLFRQFLRRMHTIMPTSQRYLDSSPWLAPVRERCHVVPLGYPLEDYRATEPINTRVDSLRGAHGDFVLFLGCLRRYKGLPYLVDAMRNVPGRRLLIAGAGPMRAELEARIAQCALADRVQLLGRVDAQEAVALLHAAAVFALPSHQRSEAFGLCQIEAMACGLPIVSCDLPTGVPEVNRHGETGLIVPPADPEALAAALRRLLDNPAERGAMGEAGRKRAQERYTIDKMADAVSEVYRAALNTESPAKL